MSPVLASLKDFVRSWVRPETVLGRRIRVALLVKLALLVTLKVAFFSGGHKPVGDEVADRFVGSDPVVGRTVQ